MEDVSKFEAAGEGDQHDAAEQQLTRTTKRPPPPTLSIKLQLNISNAALSSADALLKEEETCSSRGALCSSAVDVDPFTSNTTSPVAITVEYPQDLHVTLSAFLCKVVPSGNVAAVESLTSTQHQFLAETQSRCISVGTDANQKFNISSTTEGKGGVFGAQPPSSQSAKGQAGKVDGDAKKVAFLNDGEESWDEEGVKGAGDESLYQTVLMGNDSLFGELSAISGAADNFDLFSMNANRGSVADMTSLRDEEEEERGNDNPDGLYPTLLSDTEDICDDKALLQKLTSSWEERRDELNGPFTYDVTKKESEEDEAGDYKALTAEYEELHKLVDELLDKVELNAEQSQGQQGKSEVNNKAVSCHLELKTEIPMMSGGRQMVTSAPIILRGRQKPPGEKGATIFTVSGEREMKEEKKKGHHASELGMKYKWQSEREMSSCAHGTTSSAASSHACHICLPLPEEAIKVLQESIGLTPAEARKAAFTLIRFLREEQQSVGVKSLMKYISGVDITKKRSKRRIAQPMVYTKEQRLKAAIRSVARQKGAWGIFEDEDVVISHLNLLNQYLETLEKQSIRKALREDRYQSVKALTVYFALEKRWAVRSELLNTLEWLAKRDSTCHALFISSDLPVDLANAIKMEYIENDGGQQRIIGYAQVLLSLLSPGHHLQVDHLERLDADFVYCLLQISEGEMKDGCGRGLRDLAVSLILAYNVQFTVDELYENKVMLALSALKEVDYLKQKMLLILLNKDGGEVGSGEERTAALSPPFMVVKLARDILGCNKTSDFFLDSDLNIILAGLGSYLTQLGPGDQMRTGGLRLAREILRQLDYQHNGIRRLIHAFKGILMEKEIESRTDQKIARKIAKEIEEARFRNTQM